MFTQPDLDRLIAAMRANGVTFLEIDGEGQNLRLDLGMTDLSTERTPHSQASLVEAKSPGIGRFLPRGDDDGLDALVPGALVQAGETLGYILQGLVRVPVTAPRGGRTTGALPTANEVFGFGDVVITLDGSS